MKNEKTDNNDFGSKHTVQEGDSPKKNTIIGEDIPYADNIPPTLISDDSKNTIAEQHHDGMDNRPNGGRV